MNTHTRKTIGWFVFWFTLVLVNSFLFIREAAAANPFTLDGFYIDAAAIHASRGEGRWVEETHLVEDVRLVKPSRGWGQPYYVTNTYTVTTTYIDWSAENPYARIAIGYDVQWSRAFTTRLEWSHESSIATGRDRGPERWTLGITYRPFAR